jgi:N-acetylneuraminic acid mutarotase
MEQKQYSEEDIVEKPELKITKHSKKRSKERLGVSNKLTGKLAEKALKFGISQSDVKGNLKRYMDGLYLRHKNANNTKIYNRKVYVFHNEVLITIMNVPNNLSQAADKAQKRKE